jgi:hypothetical protein
MADVKHCTASPINEFEGFLHIFYCQIKSFMELLTKETYQVSSISVWRVTCYDHFCVFQFFSILVVSMAMAAILKKVNP